MHTPRSPLRFIAVLAAMLLFGAAACSSSNGSAEPPETSLPGTTTTIPARPVTTVALEGSSTSADDSSVDCGLRVWTNDSETATDSGPGIDCVYDALGAARTATWMSASTTVEGDWVLTQIRVEGPEAVVILTDSTRDGFGAQVVSLQRCTGLGPDGGMFAPSGTGCAPVELDRSLDPLPLPPGL